MPWRPWRLSARAIAALHTVPACPLLLPRCVRLQWACTPKGAAFLWAARSRQRDLLPLVTSHGYGLVSASRVGFALVQ